MRLDEEIGLPTVIISPAPSWNQPDTSHVPDLYALEF